MPTFCVFLVREFSDNSEFSDAQNTKSHVMQKACQNKK